MKSKEDVWIEMSIREILTQCHFAEIAYSHIDPKAESGTDPTFSSIHSFLSHCAMVSKMLKAQRDDNQSSRSFSLRFGKFSLTLKFHSDNRSVSIGKILGVLPDSPIHKRVFRNHLEHYDERLKAWIAKYPAGINIGTYNIGPKNMIRGIVFISHYDPGTDNYTFVDEDFNLGELVQEASRIKVLADNWVKSMKFNVISPPFGPSE